MSENHRNGKILALLFTGVLMGALDISIVGPALPSIDQAMHVSHRSLAWIFSIYVLFNLIGVSFLASLSDHYGRRPIYMLSVALFGVGSLVVSFAPDMAVLLTGRAIQGFGASGIFPVASAVIGDIFPPEKRGKALGMIGAVFGMAFIVGPIIAGLMLRYFTWNSLFLINIPIAIGIIYFSRKYLPAHKPGQSGHFDWPGMLLIALLLASYVYGINAIDSKDGLTGVLSWHVLPFFLLAVMSLVVFIFIESRSPAPVVKLKLFDVRQIRIVGIVAMGAGILQSVTVFVPEMAVHIFNVSSSDAAFMLIPFVVAIIAGAPLSGRMIDKVGSRWIVMTGLFTSSTGLLILILSNGSYAGFYTGGVLMGLGSSMLQGSSLRYIMLNEVRPSDRAMGQGLITLFISVGQMTGASLIGVIVASGQVRLAGYMTSFTMIVAIALAILLLSIRLKSRREEILSASPAE